MAAAVPVAVAVAVAVAMSVPVGAAADAVASAVAPSWPFDIIVVVVFVCHGVAFVFANVVANIALGILHLESRSSVVKRRYSCQSASMCGSPALLYVELHCFGYVLLPMLSSCVVRRCICVEQCCSTLRFLVGWWVVRLLRYFRQCFDGWGALVFVWLRNFP